MIRFITLITLLFSGCSFKKDPQSKSPHPETKQLFEVVTSDRSSEAIASIDHYDMTNLDPALEAKTLRYALIRGDIGIVKALLKKGFSPYQGDALHANYLPNEIYDHNAYLEITNKNLNIISTLNSAIFAADFAPADAILSDNHLDCEKLMDLRQDYAIFVGSTFTNDMVSNKFAEYIKYLKCDIKSSPRKHVWLSKEILSKFLAPTSMQESEVFQILANSFESGEFIFSSDLIQDKNIAPNELLTDSLTFFDNEIYRQSQALKFIPVIQRISNSNISADTVKTHSALTLLKVDILSRMTSRKDCILACQTNLYPE